MVEFVRSRWPLRRRVALLALFPVVAAWFVVIGRAAGPVPPGAAWYAVVAPVALLGAAVLASYVPLTGRGLDLGCTPCAMFSGLTVLGATTVIHNYGAEIVGPLVGGAVLLFGLTQRMNQPGTCAAPVGGPR